MISSQHIALDANCFIDALAAGLPSGLCVQRLLTLAASGAIRVFVSRHTIVELEAGSAKDGGAAARLAMTASLLHYQPIGAIQDLVGNIQDLPGTFNDWHAWSAESDKLRMELRAGAGIRDLGALFDAIAGKCEVFVTSDRQLCDPAIASRVSAQWQISVMTPADAEQRFSAPEV